jgi:RNA-directed DNA polymerase
MTGSFSPEDISTKRRRIAELASKNPEMVLTTLAHHIDQEWLRAAFEATSKRGASGIDGQTAEAYAGDLDANLASLLNRAKTGSYHAPPVRRAYIPKGNGQEKRPIGIPTFEDKVLQRAVVMVLEPVYEQDFLECSYGYRPGRSAHQALEALREQLMAVGGGWVIEVDIRKFFDTLDHRHLQEIVRHRVRDGVLVRLIGKWLNAGVLEERKLSYPEAGTPQGGVISPLLANIYLHEVLDIWFERQVKPRMTGRTGLVRYADDFVMVFEHERDARRVFEVLPKRFAAYGLTLHPEKTKLLYFGSPGRPGGRDREPDAFDFLAFRHYWAKSRKGWWVVKRKTAATRFTRSLKRIAAWCRAHRHDPLVCQQRALSLKLKGHYQYFGITGNWAALGRFHHEVTRAWKKWLGRRSQQGMSWKRFTFLLTLFPLPPPVAVHSIYRRGAKP